MFNKYTHTHAHMCAHTYTHTHIHPSIRNHLVCHTELFFIHTNILLQVFSGCDPAHTTILLYYMLPSRVSGARGGGGLRRRRAPTGSDQSNVILKEGRS